MSVNFIPDGKTKGMSIISHIVDAEETAKGKKGAKEAKGAQAAAAAQGGGEGGKLSKKEAKKAEKKAAKKAGKSDAVPAEAKGKAKKGGAQAGAPKAAAAPAKEGAIDGALADWLENKLGASQWFGGAKQTQADAEALKLLNGAKPDPESHPGLFGWAAMATKFAEPVVKKWPAGSLGVPASLSSSAGGATAITIQAQPTYFSGPAADRWEGMLRQSGAQWLLGQKLTQADA